MASGIYRLTFSSGKYYVGKSLDLETRWKQHFNKFATGKAARPMQLEYDQCGLPKTEVLFYCHKDHIDILEEWLIDQFKGPNMLNTTYPDIERTADIATLIDSSHELLAKSTWEHLGIIQENASVTYELEARIAAAEAQVTKYREEGYIIDDDYIQIVDIAQTLADKLEPAQEELKRLKKLSLFDRIFNYKVKV
jgi:hypothetical protein